MQCRQTAKILEKFLPGILGRGQIRCREILNGNANNAPLNGAAGLDLGGYEEVLAVLGLKGDLSRWYRDQSYCIEIREMPSSRRESYPSAPVKWRLTDPCSELNHAYSRSLASMVVDVTGQACCGESFIYSQQTGFVACRDRVVVILRDCGSLELGSNPGPGP